MCPFTAILNKAVDIRAASWGCATFLMRRLGHACDDRSTCRTDWLKEGTGLPHAAGGDASRAAGWLTTHPRIQRGGQSCMHVSERTFSSYAPDAPNERPLLFGWRRSGQGAKTELLQEQGMPYFNRDSRNATALLHAKRDGKIFRSR
jgi:hypothetical protein